MNSQVQHVYTMDTCSILCCTNTTVWSTYFTMNSRGSMVVYNNNRLIVCLFYRYLFLYRLRYWLLTQQAAVPVQPLLRRLLHLQRLKLQAELQWWTWHLAHSKYRDNRWSQPHHLNQPKEGRLDSSLER